MPKSLRTRPPPLPAPTSCSRCAARRVDEIKALKPGAMVFAMLDPFGDRRGPRRARRARAPALFSMEFMPRITRAQSMDVLSCQANLAGYKAVVDAASHVRAGDADDDDGGRHGAGRQGLHHGRRRCGPAGDRDRAPPRRHRVGDRRPPGDQGAGRIARRQVHRRRGRRVQAGPDRGRLRQSRCRRSTRRSRPNSSPTTSRTRTSSSPRR